MEETNSVVNSNDNGNQQPTEQNGVQENGNNEKPNSNANQTQPVQFSAEQQAKVNSLLKEEKSKIYSKYGVSKSEELDELVNAGKEYKENKEKYSNQETELLSLRAENALIKNGVKDDMTEVVQNYFKGAGLELNAKNLEQLFTEKPALKEQWCEKVVAPQVVIGNAPQNQKSQQQIDKEEYEALKRKIGINY